jgi:hypothetical protein
MESTNEKLCLQLGKKKTGKIIYQYEVELVNFQKEIIENKDVSFYYTFKDMGVELEENILLKLKLGENKDELSFVIKYLDKTLYESTLDITGIDEKDIQKNEVQLYFIFAKISKNIINKISEIHKDIILSNIEKN